MTQVQITLSLENSQCHLIFSSNQIIGHCQSLMTLYSKLHLNSHLATFSLAVAKKHEVVGILYSAKLGNKRIGFYPPQVISPLDAEISKHLSYLNP